MSTEIGYKRLLILVLPICYNSGLNTDQSLPSFCFIRAAMFVLVFKILEVSTVYIRSDEHNIESFKVI
jgi:hypothetical protein